MFRGKTLDNKWVEGYYIVICDRHYIYNYTFHEVIPDTVGLYRGYPDKNVKKIHEGDIHKNKGNYYVVLLGYFTDAVTNKAMYGWHIKNKQNKCFAMDGSEADSINIVGNIFDNGDLLKG
jgi:uncharacterized phage protein (TIGR01671 family)